MSPSQISPWWLPTGHSLGHFEVPPWPRDSMDILFYSVMLVIPCTQEPQGFQTPLQPCHFALLRHCLYLIFWLLPANCRIFLPR